MVSLLLCVHQSLNREFHIDFIGKRQCASTSLQLEVVVNFNMLSRLKEEETLLLREMRSYIDFYRQCLTSLDHTLQGGIMDSYILLMFIHYLLYIFEDVLQKFPLPTLAQEETNTDQAIHGVGHIAVTTYIHYTHVQF